MKAKLIKHTEPDFYFITNEDGSTFATTDDWYFKNTKSCLKLSMKNCKAIENDYPDVDKLAYDYSWNTQSDPEYGTTISAYKKGFNKAMDLNKDKKFTLDDIRNAVYTGVKIGRGTPFIVPATDEYIESLQQTEWDVNIEMETPPTTYGHSGWHEQPKLDTDGCLILKKI